MLMLSGWSIFRLCFASGLWAFGFGVGMQVISHWLHQAHEASDGLIGLVQATYYLGIALASLATPRLIRRWGNGCTTLGMVVAGLSLAIYPLTTEVGWFGLRLLNGAAGALSLIPLETLVSRDSAKEKRTRNFAFYAVALTLGGALGIGVGLTCVDPAGLVAAWAGEWSTTIGFLLGGTAPLAGAVLVGQGFPGTPPAQSSAARITRLDFRQHFLSYGTAWGQGFLEGGMLAFLSLYLITQGFSAQQAGLLMGVTLVGVILFQVPAGWLADRWGNLTTLFFCYGVVLGGLALVPWLTTPWELGICLFLFGACSGAMYPLGLALLGEDMPAEALPRAYARYLALECVGSQMGAAAMGQARDWWGGMAMFPVACAGVALVLVLWFLLPRNSQISVNGEAENPSPPGRAAA